MLNGCSSVKQVETSIMKSFSRANWFTLVSDEGRGSGWWWLSWKHLCLPVWDFSITWREWPDWRHSWVEENLRIVRAFTPTEREFPAKAEQESPYLICPSVLTRASVKSAYCSRNKPDLWPPSAWVCIILQLPPLPTPARLWTFSLPVTPPYVSLPKVVCGNVRSDGSKRVLTNWIKTGWMMYTPHTLLNRDKRPTPVTTPPPTGKAYNTQQKFRACGNRPLHASTQSNMHLYD